MVRPELPFLSKFRPPGSSVSKSPHEYRPPAIWKAPALTIVKIDVYGKAKHLRAPV